MLKAIFQVAQKAPLQISFSRFQRSHFEAINLTGGNPFHSRTHYILTLSPKIMPTVLIGMLVFNWLWFVLDPSLLELFTKPLTIFSSTWDRIVSLKNLRRGCCLERSNFPSKKKQQAMYLTVKQKLPDEIFNGVQCAHLTVHAAGICNVLSHCNTTFYGGLFCCYNLHCLKTPFSIRRSGGKNDKRTTYTYGRAAMNMTMSWYSWNQESEWKSWNTQLFGWKALQMCMMHSI